MPVRWLPLLEPVYSWNDVLVEVLFVVVAGARRFLRGGGYDGCHTIISFNTAKTNVIAFWFNLINTGTVEANAPKYRSK